MYNELTSGWIRSLGGKPAFQIYGRSRPELRWRVIDVFATHRRDCNSRWPAPFFAGTAITWCSHVIEIGWDFAVQVYLEQREEPATRDNPLQVQAGRLRDSQRRLQHGFRSRPSVSEIIAHECGHTRQAVQLQFVFLPVGAFFTLFREGNRWYNLFENQASECGQFGGILPDSIHPRLLAIEERLSQKALSHPEEPTS